MERNQDVRDQAMEDLSLIRQVLDQTAASFSTLAPTFRRLGVLWLVLCLPTFLIGLRDVLGFLFPDPIGDWPAMRVPGVYDGLRLALVVVLVVQCLLWQRDKKGFQGFDRKLLTIWQVLLLLFLVLSVLARVGIVMKPQEMIAVGDPMWYQEEMRTGISTGVGNLLSTVFPGLPLLISGILLEERLPRVLGLLMVLFDICSLLAWFFPLGSALYWVALAVGMLAPLFPPVTILLMAWRLGKRPEGG